MYGAMTIEITISGDWIEADCGERFCRFAHLVGRYEKICIDVAAQLRCVVQPARHGGPAKKNTVDTGSGECGDDFCSGSIDQDRLRGSPFHNVSSGDRSERLFPGIHDG
jgi:hypothetical protein